MTSRSPPLVDYTQPAGLLSHHISLLPGPRGAVVTATAALVFIRDTNAGTMEEMANVQFGLGLFHVARQKALETRDR